MNMSKCERCTERCPQAEMAHEIAKGRYYAIRDLVKCAPYWNILFDENGNQRITPDHLRDLIQAEQDGRMVVLDEKTCLSMLAGARAIENNKRLFCVTYSYDIFGEYGGPKEIPYYYAAKKLREIVTPLLERSEAAMDGKGCDEG